MIGHCSLGDINYILIKTFLCFEPNFTNFCIIFWKRFDCWHFFSVSCADFCASVLPDDISQNRQFWTQNYQLSPQKNRLNMLYRAPRAPVWRFFNLQIVWFFRNDVVSSWKSSSARANQNSVWNDVIFPLDRDWFQT